MIIKEEPERSIYVYSSIDIKKLAKELVRDIKTNIDEWVWWNFDLDYDSPEQEIKEYKEELSSMCRKLSKLVGEK